MINDDSISAFLDEYGYGGGGRDGSSSGLVRYGCTDPQALNYNTYAEVDDGSCTYERVNTNTSGPENIPGCTDRDAANYNPSATFNDGSCFYTQEILGCTDPSAVNYNPSATKNDGSCINYIPLPPIDMTKTIGCGDVRALNYNPSANVIDNSTCQYPIVPPPPTRVGCTNPKAKNYDATALADDGSCIFYSVDDLQGQSQGGAITTSPGTPPSSVYGCTNATARNYNRYATIDDGSCIYHVRGCTVSSAANYNPEATLDDGTCVFQQIIYGCTNPVAINYNRLANRDDGTCNFSQPKVGCKNTAAKNYDASALIHDPSICVFDAPLLPPAQEPPLFSSVNLNAEIEILDGGKSIPVSFSVVDPSPAGNIRIEVEPIELNISPVILGLINVFLADAYNTFIDPSRFYKLLLNFGRDSQSVIANYRLNPVNRNELQLKLTSPISPTVGVNTPVFLSRELAKTFIDEIKIAFAAPKDRTPYLRPLNTKISVPGNYKETRQATLETLNLLQGAAGNIENAATFSDSIFRKWYSYDWDSTELNQDFSDYNKFVFYGSAELRLKSFREKIRQLEIEQSKVVQNVYQLTTGSAFTGSNSQLAGPICLGSASNQVTVVSSSLAAYPTLASASKEAALRIEHIIRSFDPYERYLFYSDGSTPYSASADYAIDGYEYFATGSWPRNEANQLYSHTSSVSLAWFAAQSVIAQRFDEHNQNSLMYTIPNHIYYDDDSQSFITFVLTVGHFFDNLKPYIDQMTTNIYDRKFDPEEGMSIDLVWEIAETFGIKLPNPYSIYSVQEYILPSGVSSTEVRNISAETWKRFLHNLIFLLKTRGTKTAINAFLRILGIHPQVISVKESETNTTSSFFVTEEFSNGLEFNGVNDAYIKVPLSSSLRDVKTLQIRYATGIAQDTTLANADNNFALNIATYVSDSRYGRLELVSGSNVIVSSSYIKMFDNKFTDVMLRRYGSYIDMTVIRNDGEEVIYSSSNVSTISSIVGLWTSSKDFYIGGSGSIKKPLQFDGIVDEIRAWGELIEDDTFIAQTYDPGSYTGNTYTSSIDNLFVQLSFNTEANLTARYLPNETPYFNLDGVSDPLDILARTNIELIEAEGFVSNSSYTRFSRKVRLNTPTFGGSTYTTTKVKIADPPVFRPIDLDSNNVPVLKRKSSIVTLNEKQLKKGTNLVSLTISPSDFQNQNISRAFGGFNVNNLIGDPAEIAAPEYKKLKELQKIYSKHFYSKVDTNRLIRIFETVLDGMTEFVDFLMPLKSKLQTGILIEPNILERVKVSNYKNISVDGSQTRNSLRAANTASIYPATDYIYALEKTIDIRQTSYNPKLTFNETTDYDEYGINLTGSTLLPQFFDGITLNPSSSAERLYITHLSEIDISDKLYITSSIYSGGMDIPLFTTGAIFNNILPLNLINVEFNSPSELTREQNYFLLDLITTGSRIDTRDSVIPSIDFGTSARSGSVDLGHQVLDLVRTGSILDQRVNYIIGGKDYFGNYNSLGEKTTSESIATFGMFNINNVVYESGSYFIKNKLQTENIIDTEINNIRKWGVKFDGNRIKYVTDGTGEVYPFAMGISLGNDANGNPLDRTNIKYLYDIAPLADFSDLGVTTYFYKDDGLYRFPEKTYSVVGKNTYNFLAGTYNDTKVLSGSFAEWNYGSTYNENDVVVQNISTINDVSNNTISTLKQLRSKVINQIEVVRLLREQLAVETDELTRINLIDQVRTAQNTLDARTEEYNKLRDDIRYAASGNKYFYRFKRKTSLSPYYSYIPPAVDKENWELLVYVPELRQSPRRVLLDTDQLDIYSRVFSRLTIVKPEQTGDIIGRNEFALKNNISISGNQTVQGILNLAKVAELLAIKFEDSTNYRIRLYRTSTQRQSDASRAFGDEPIGDHGVLFDAIVNNNIYNILSPTVRLVNGDAPEETAIYYSITNLDSIAKVFKIKLYLYVYEGEKRVPIGYLPRHYKFSRDNSTATKRRNYLGCLQTQDTTTDGLSPIEVSTSSGTDITATNTSPNDSVILGGGGTLNVT